MRPTVIDPKTTTRTPAAFCSGCRRASLRWKNRQPERGQEGLDDQKKVLTWKIYLKRMRSASVIEILQR